MGVNLTDNLLNLKKILETKIKYLIYVSTPLGFNKKNINSILEISNLNNKKNNITGCLIYRSDLYLQFLEGPSKELENTYNGILKDKRHSDIKKLSENNTKRRLFANWAMRGDPLITSMWNNKDVMEGTVKKLKSADAFKIFEKVSREIDQFN